MKYCADNSMWPIKQLCFLWLIPSKMQWYCFEMNDIDFCCDMKELFSLINIQSIKACYILTLWSTANKHCIIEILFLVSYFLFNYSNTFKVITNINKVITYLIYILLCLNCFDEFKHQNYNRYVIKSYKNISFTISFMIF